MRNPPQKNKGINILKKFRPLALSEVSSNGDFAGGFVRGNHIAAIEESPASSAFFSGLIDNVEQGVIQPEVLDLFGKWQIHMFQLASDGKISVLSASSRMDNSPFINLFRTHEQYITEYERVVDSNPILQRLHQQLADRGIQIRLSDDFTPVTTHRSNVFAGAFTDEKVGAPAYRLFTSQEEVIDWARRGHLPHSSFEEARQALAEWQVQRVAGHETYHYAYRNLLTPEQQARWNTFVQSNWDRDFRNAMNRLESKDYSLSEISEEMFTYRMHYHTFGTPEWKAMGFEPSPQEIDVFMDIGLLPHDFNYIPEEIPLQAAVGYAMVNLNLFNNMINTAVLVE